MGYHNTKWTDEMCQQLRDLWKAGKSAAEIARIIGNVSRNGVIGKAHRLKLERRSNPVVKKKLGDLRQYNNQTITKSPPTHPKSKASMTIYGEGKALVDIGRNECRWPVGENANMIFCAAKTDKGKSYCKEHLIVNPT